VVCFEFSVSLFICICWIMSTKIFFNHFLKFSINITFHLLRFSITKKHVLLSICYVVITTTMFSITIINWYRFFNNICLSFAFNHILNIKHDKTIYKSMIMVTHNLNGWQGILLVLPSRGKTMEWWLFHFVCLTYCSSSNSSIQSINY
jgi:hypothetical protein